VQAIAHMPRGMRRDVTPDACPETLQLAAVLPLSCGESWSWNLQILVTEFGSDLAS
jgi:hypothetical protein